MRREGKYMNSSQTIAEFIGNARHNALLLKQIVAAVYGTSEENITINIKLEVREG